MKHWPVLWSEGMFLLPHHFQAADRHGAEQRTVADQLDHEYGYGIRSLTFSTEAIENFHFQVTQCSARLRDGTLVVLEDGNRVATREALSGATTADLTQGFGSGPSVTVYLGVPIQKSDEPGVFREDGPPAGGSAQPSMFRFRESRRMARDESFIANEQEISLKVINARLLLSTEDTNGFETIPLAKIMRSGKRAGIPELDTSYIPPLLAVDGWEPLSIDIIRVIYDFIGKKMEILTAQISERDINWSSQEPGDVDSLYLLSQLNEAYAWLAVNVFARGVHPITMYSELCRLVGKLSIFSETFRTPDIPRYDHDNLGYIFAWVRDQIFALLDRIRPPSYEVRAFIGAGLGLQVSLEQRWLGSDWKWFVRVFHESLTEKDCLELLAPNQLNWKLGSSGRVEVLFERGIPGLTLTPMARPPREVQSRPRWTYFEVTRDGPEWKEVLSTQTLAMRMRDMLILNYQDLQGKQRMTVKFRGREVPLEFYLIAVPKQS